MRLKEGHYYCNLFGHSRRGSDGALAANEQRVVGTPPTLYLNDIARNRHK